MRRPMPADSRHVDERSDATPRDLREPLDRFLVMVDRWLPAGCGPSMAGSPKVEEKQTTVRVVRLTMISLQKRFALAAHSRPNLKDNQSRQSIQGERRRAFETRTSHYIPRELRRRRRRSKIGEWMATSETASQTGRINQSHTWGSIGLRTRRANAFALVQTSSHATELGHPG
jgi:hypothetical protein